MPPVVIRRAKKYLAALEAIQVHDHPQTQLPFSAPVEPEIDLLADTLDDIDPDGLTPREALEALYSLKKLRDEQN